MSFSATFNNISALSWRSVLLVGVPGETRIPAASHILLYRVHLAWAGFELSTLVVIFTDCIGSCKSNYHTITTTTIPRCEFYILSLIKTLTYREYITAFVYQIEMARKTFVNENLWFHCNYGS